MGWRKGLVGVASVVAAVFCARPARGQDRGVTEAVLKAEFVERFTRFIDWPRDAMAAGAPFRVCVIGTSPVAAPLEQLARMRRFKGRTASFVRVTTLDGMAACHLVFIGGSERQRIDDIVARTVGRPILTVGDTDGYSPRGVIINLYRSQSRLRFEINIVAALDSGLRFRSKLLKLARVTGVEDGALR